MTLVEIIEKLEEKIDESYKNGYKYAILEILQELENKKEYSACKTIRKYFGL